MRKAKNDPKSKQDEQKGLWLDLLSKIQIGIRQSEAVEVFSLDEAKKVVEVDGAVEAPAYNLRLKSSL